MSQCSEILALLETGPKTTREILREVPSIVHSRVADLRRQGHNIVCETIGTGAGGHRYHLLSSTETGLTSPASGDLDETLPPEGSGHVGESGSVAASSGPSPLFDREDAQLELDLIERKLGNGIPVDSENARSTHAIMRRQRDELLERLA